MHDARGSNDTLIHSSHHLSAESPAHRRTCLQIISLINILFTRSVACPYTAAAIALYLYDAISSTYQPPMHARDIIVTTDWLFRCVERSTCSAHCAAAVILFTVYYRARVDVSGHSRQSMV